MGCIISKNENEEIKKRLTDKMINKNLDYITFNKEIYNPIEINEKELIKVYYKIEEYLETIKTIEYYDIFMWLYEKDIENIYNFRKVDIVYLMKRKIKFTRIIKNEELLIKEFSSV
jgi:hypothetical protein